MGNLRMAPKVTTAKITVGEAKLVRWLIEKGPQLVAACSAPVAAGALAKQFIALTIKEGCSVRPEERRYRVTELGKAALELAMRTWEPGALGQISAQFRKKKSGASFTRKQTAKQKADTIGDEYVAAPTRAEPPEWMRDPSQLPRRPPTANGRPYTPGQSR